MGKDLAFLLIPWGKLRGYGDTPEIDGRNIQSSTTGGFKLNSWVNFPEFIR